MVADILCCVCLCLLDFSGCFGNVALTAVVFFIWDVVADVFGTFVV